ncbi:PQQ-dependent sugar dehydrogenase [Streptomyces hainanensis]|uniref:PQQ-dependent sugar dehydrogenase n=1 Tax=Streptomyces hainanensis TaxID=402648 RepID=A0A4R4TMH0_9ACTN|nr:PQQ-dependent sugar dehydrogenase [Streptomyces hainanensis]TDC79288.1 PQQ-dependent sugar dehydrogenase [Streptomyces hainanensis]
MHARTLRRLGTALAATGLVAALLGAAPAATPPAAPAPLSAPAAISQLSTGWSVPWGMDWLPDGSALYAERDTHRVVRLAPNGTRTVVGTVPNVVSGGEGGLLGLAVSPNFATDRAFYVFHTAASDNRIARLTFDGTAIGGYQPILTGIARATYHNGGRLAFGPDGHLYATTGDAQQTGLAQNTQSLNGKILRLTTTGAPAPGNPFGNHVYSYGHRNPQGLAWDAAGRLWAAELGQNTWDELNLITQGANYGWPVCEGVCGRAGMTDPRRTWSTAEASPSGLAYADGALYLAALRGQRLWRIPLNGTEAGTPQAYYQGQLGRLRTVATVPGGTALWLSTSNGDSAGAPQGRDGVHVVTLR